MIWSYSKGKIFRSLSHGPPLYIESRIATEAHHDLLNSHSDIMLLIRQAITKWVNATCHLYQARSIDRATVLIYYVQVCHTVKIYTLLYCSYTVLSCY